MPIITIKMLEGRDKRKKKELIAKVTTSVTETLQVPAENVRIVIQEVPLEHYGVAGLPIKEYLLKKVGKKKP